jgi:hypothetical protein
MAGKLVQHWPRTALHNKDAQCVGSDYSESDLWSDLCQVTLGDGGLFVIGLYDDDNRVDTIREALLQNGSTDLGRLLFFKLVATVRDITVLARREVIKYGLRNVGTDKITWTEAPALPERTEKRTFDKRFHLGTVQNLTLMVAAINERNGVMNLVRSYSGEDVYCPISTVLIMEPNLEEDDP